MLRLFARLVSILFHPLLILTYILMILLLLDPYSFGVNSISTLDSRILILRIFLSTFFIPAFAIAMLSFLGMVSSISLPEKQERIGPYIITSIFYLWLFRNFLDSSIVPPIYAGFMLGAVVSLFLAFLINIFSRISTHTIGMGSLIGMLVVSMIMLEYDTFLLQSTWMGNIQINLLALLLFTVVAAGLVGTARMILQKRPTSDLYGGYLIGFAAQFIALQIMISLGKLSAPVTGLVF